jgi:hypothetical protein
MDKIAGHEVLMYWKIAGDAEMMGPLSITLSIQHGGGMEAIAIETRLDKRDKCL